MAKNNGGPAFPVKNPVTEEQFSGMTLRDWFAGQALNGILASPRSPLNDEGKPDHQVSAHNLARLSYAVADAMIKERGK